MNTNFAPAAAVIDNAIHNIAAEINAHCPATVRDLLETTFPADSKARMVYSFGDPESHGWRDSGTLEMLHLQGADEAEGLTAESCALACALLVPGPNGIKLRVWRERHGSRVLVEVDWEYSDSAACYGGLFELAPVA